LEISKINSGFWSGKKVFLTGHTGFKGGWLSLWLSSMRAEVTGYSLAPNTNPNLYSVAHIESIQNQSYIADIRNLDALSTAIKYAQPDILFHMAAQPLVRYSYLNPVETYATNIMGTVNVLESVRLCDSIKSVVIITTDKCYDNKEWEWGYRENEAMGGHDPYSSSKGCAELVTSAYRNSFFNKHYSPSIATARAGNVIGGGDWSGDRLIPDAIKAFENAQSLILRNPLSTRPWQHVLEPLSGYLMLAEKLYSEGNAFASSWNFGPLDSDTRTVEEVTNMLIKEWGQGANWRQEGNDQPYEANFLKLDCSKARKYLNWSPKWSLETAMIKIVEWQRAYKSQQSMLQFSLKQINEYMKA